MNQPLNVFLAEDSCSDVFLVRRALSEHGLECELVVAEDGDSAALLLGRMGRDAPCPDIALIDLHLPKTGGPELVRLLREHPQCASVPIIVITSSDSPKERAQMSALGVSAYFRKPTDLAGFMTLGRVVHSVLQNGPEAEIYPAPDRFSISRPAPDFQNVSFATKVETNCPPMQHQPP